MSYPVQSTGGAVSIGRSPGPKMLRGWRSTTQSEPTPPDDSVDVAETSALIERIDEAAGRVPAVDEARIAALQQAIASGTVTPNPQQIARKAVEFEMLLG
jgi:flagellar biosynthesis anti-sigma factor FlgM